MREKGLEERGLKARSKNSDLDYRFWGFGAEKILAFFQGFSLAFAKKARKGGSQSRSSSQKCLC